MKSLFHQVSQSVRDKNFGQYVTTQSYRSSLTYWLKWLFLLSLIPAVLFIGGVTYFIPQLPGLLQKNLPDVTLTMTKGHLTTSFPQPVTWSDANFTLIVNSQADPAALDKVNQGFLIRETDMYIKDNGQVQYVSYSQVPDFSVTKTGVIKWISDNQLKILLAAVVGILVATLLVLLGYSLFKIVVFFILGGSLWLISKLLKTPVSYLTSVKLIIFASVPALIVTTFGSFLGSPIFSYLSWLVLIYFSVTWLTHLAPPVSSPPAAPEPLPPSTSQTRKKPETAP